MHLVPAERAHLRAIDDHTVCDAIEGIGDPPRVRAWAETLGLLSDPGRLSLLLAVDRAGPIAVSDLAIATGIRDTAVSQALRLLRASGAVRADRDGRVVRYSLQDPRIARLLAALRTADAEATPPSSEPGDGQDSAGVSH